MAGETGNPLIDRTLKVFTEEFGQPEPATNKKVSRWLLRPSIGVVVQLDQPRKQGAYIWVPFPAGAPAPTSAHEVYPADKGRHSGTNAVPGLEGGKPAVKLIVESETALAEAVQYIKARARM